MHNASIERTQVLAEEGKQRRHRLEAVHESRATLGRKECGGDADVAPYVEHHVPLPNVDAVSQVDSLAGYLDELVGEVRPDRSGEASSEAQRSAPVRQPRAILRRSSSSPTSIPRNKFGQCSAMASRASRVERLVSDSVEPAATR